jgi:hypothetical protein
LDFEIQINKILIQYPTEKDFLLTCYIWWVGNIIWYQIHENRTSIGENIRLYPKGMFHYIVIDKNFSHLLCKALSIIKHLISYKKIMFPTHQI